MGNWRTVNIDGVVKDQNDVDAIRKALVWDKKFCWESTNPMFFLQFGDGLASLGEWIPEIAGTEIHVAGNLFERDCEVDELGRELSVFAEKCPSANLVVNAGGDWESLTCVATFVIKDGTCERTVPKIPALREISEKMMLQRLRKAIYG